MKYQKSNVKNQISKIGSVPIFIFIIFTVFSVYCLLSTVYSQEEEILSSEELTIRAWEALAAKDYKEAISYADRCIELYQEEANRQQASLKDFPVRGKEEQFRALNDVATSLFIKGEALRAQRRWNEAKEVFNKIIDNYSFAQCWDPRGWFWKVAEESKIKLEKIDKAMEASQN